MNNPLSAPINISASDAISAKPPKLIKELHEISGPLHGFEQASAKLLAVQIGSRNVLLPIEMREKLGGLKGQQIAITLIRGKYYVRRLKGVDVHLGVVRP